MCKRSSRGTKRRTTNNAHCMSQSSYVVRVAFVRQGVVQRDSALTVFQQWTKKMLRWVMDAVRQCQTWSRRPVATRRSLLVLGTGSEKLKGNVRMPDCPRELVNEEKSHDSIPDGRLMAMVERWLSGSIQISRFVGLLRLFYRSPVLDGSDPRCHSFFQLLEQCT